MVSANTLPSVNIPSTLTPATDIKLVVVDMDGTLLDGDGLIPPDLGDVVGRLQERGIAFSPASGRQYYTLHDEFSAIDSGGMVYIAENGTLVMQDGKELASTMLDVDLVHEIVRTVREVGQQTRVGIVVCGKDTAYVESDEQQFREQVDHYYAKVTKVDDLLSIDEPALKIAMYAYVSSERDVAPHLQDLKSRAQVVISSPNWVDVMPRDANKGRALAQVQELLGITPAQTMVFGDYLNDLEMLDQAQWSFAMANSHHEVFDHARYVAPANTRYGVMQVLARLLG